MQLNEFEQKYTGKRPDQDGVYEAQCVDLIKLYCIEVLDCPVIKGDGVDYKMNPLPQYFDYHNNDPFYIPPVGSIATWNGNVGDGKGHVAIVLEAWLMSLVSLDLNWPYGAVVQRVKHRYTNIQGFLIPRPRGTIQQYNQLVDELRNLATKYPKL